MFHAISLSSFYPFSLIKNPPLNLPFFVIFVPTILTFLFFLAIRISRSLHQSTMICFRKVGGMIRKTLMHSDHIFGSEAGISSCCSMDEDVPIHQRCLYTFVHVWHVNSQNSISSLFYLTPPFMNCLSSAFFRENLQ